MTTIQKIMMTLECTEFYAEKIINSCNDEKEIGELVAWKLEEKRTRKGIVEYG